MDENRGRDKEKGREGNCKETGEKEERIKKRKGEERGKNSENEKRVWKKSMKGRNRREKKK